MNQDDFDKLLGELKAFPQQETPTDQPAGLSDTDFQSLLQNLQALPPPEQPSLFTRGLQQLPGAGFGTGIQRWGLKGVEGVFDELIEAGKGTLRTFGVDAPAAEESFTFDRDPRINQFLIREGNDPAFIRSEVLRLEGEGDLRTFADGQITPRGILQRAERQARSPQGLGEAVGAGVAGVLTLGQGGTRQQRAEIATAFGEFPVGGVAGGPAAAIAEGQALGAISALFRGKKAQAGTLIRSLFARGARTEPTTALAVRQPGVQPFMRPGQIDPTRIISPGMRPLPPGPAQATALGTRGSLGRVQPERTFPIGPQGQPALPGQVGIPGPAGPAAPGALPSARPFAQPPGPSPAGGFPLPGPRGRIAPGQAIPQPGMIQPRPLRLFVVDEEFPQGMVLSFENTAPNRALVADLTASGQRVRTLTQGTPEEIAAARVDLGAQRALPPGSEPGIAARQQVLEQAAAEPVGPALPSPLIRQREPAPPAGTVRAAVPRAEAEAGIAAPRPADVGNQARIEFAQLEREIFIARRRMDRLNAEFRPGDPDGVIPARDAAADEIRSKVARKREIAQDAFGSENTQIKASAETELIRDELEEELFQRQGDIVRLDDNLPRFRIPENLPAQLPSAGRYVAPRPPVVRPPAPPVPRPPRPSTNPSPVEPPIGPPPVGSQATSAADDIGPNTRAVLDRVSFGEPGPSFREKVQSGLATFMRTVIDDINRLGMSAKLSREAGFNPSALEDPYINARLLTSSVKGKAHAFLNDGTFGRVYWKMEDGRAVPNLTGPSLKTVLQPVKEADTFEKFTAYLTARRNLELARTRPDVETGITVAQAQGALNELARTNPEFPQIAQQVRTYREALLDYGAESGLFSPEFLARMKANQDFVSFHRVMEGMQKKGFFGKKLANITSPIKRIKKGGKQKIISPLEVLVRDTDAIISASERTQVMTMLHNEAMRTPMFRELFNPKRTPVTRVATVTAKELGITVEGVSPNDVEVMMDVFRPLAFAKDGTEVTYRIGGKTRFADVPDSEIYQALLGLNKQEIGMLIKFIGAPARWLRAGAVLFPDFIGKNFTRDQTTAFIYSKHGYIPGVDWIKGVGQVLGKSDDALLFKISGAEGANLISVDRNMSGKTIEQIVKERGFKGKLVDHKNPIEALRIVAETTENGTRLGEFSKALDAGANPVEGAFGAREVSQDFNKMGTYTRAINQVIPFFGATIGGYTRFAVAMKERPLLTAAKAFLGITLPSILLYSVNRDNPEYQEWPQWLKDVAWAVPLPGTDRLIPWPKPPFLGQIFGSMPERFMEYLDERDPDLFADGVRTSIDHNLPGFFPQFALASIENASNHSFFRDAPIVSRSREGLPAELQYSGSTPEVIKALGNWVNVSPAGLENWFNAWTGSLGRSVANELDPIIKKLGLTPDISEPARDISEFPIGKLFIARDPLGSGSASVERFYNRLKKAEKIKNAQNTYLKLGEGKRAIDHRDANPNEGWVYRADGTYTTNVFTSLNKIALEISRRRKEQNQVMIDRTITPQEKREAKDEYNLAITNLARNAIGKIPIPTDPVPAGVQ